MQKLIFDIAQQPQKTLDLKAVENNSKIINSLVNIKKEQKNCEMAKPFYFWQTVSKRPNLEDLAFKKAKWQP